MHGTVLEKRSLLIINLRMTDLPAMFRSQHEELTLIQSQNKYMR